MIKKLPAPVAHIYPSTLAEFETAETSGQCYSVSVGCPDEVSVPLCTIEAAKQAMRDVLGDAAQLARDAFGTRDAEYEIRKLKEQL